MIYDVLVVGGGASGLAAAIMAARAGADNVLVIEKQPRVGKKLLATGNGRCNLTNLGARACDYAGDNRLAEHVFEAFSPERVLEFFASLGLMWRADEHKRVYPRTNQASTVLDCLRLGLKTHNIPEICGFAAKRAAPESGAFSVISADGRAYKGKRVIICAGGRAAPKLGGGGDFEALLKPHAHVFTRQSPALAPLITDKKQIAGLKGIRFQGDIALEIDARETARETGEILFTDSGVSGIAAMQLSGAAARALENGARVELMINLLGMDYAQAREFILSRAHALKEHTAREFLTGAINKMLSAHALEAGQVNRAGNLDAPISTWRESALVGMARALVNWRLTIISTAGYDSAQIMQGGARADDFNLDTLESRHTRGLYAAGELFDIAGPCGGYNLQWAWASGLRAGECAARSL